MSDPTLSFGDNVRIRATSLTEKLGLAGQTGKIYGETKPTQCRFPPSANATLPRAPLMSDNDALQRIGRAGTVLVKQTRLGGRPAGE